MGLVWVGVGPFRSDGGENPGPLLRRWEQVLWWRGHGWEREGMVVFTGTAAHTIHTCGGFQSFFFFLDSLQIEIVERPQFFLICYKYDLITDSWRDF